MPRIRSAAPPAHRNSGRPPTPGNRILEDARLQALTGLLSGHRNPRARRIVAATLAGLAVLTLGTGLRSNETTSASTLVASRAIGAGQVIGADDLTTGRWGATAPLGLMTDLASVVGRRSAVPIAKGMAIASNALVGPSLLSEPGLVLAPVRLFDPGAGDLLVAGDRIDLLAAATGIGGLDGEADPRPADVVAADVRVVATPARESAGSSSAFLGSEARASAGGTVLLAVDRATATRIAAAAAIARLSIVVRSR